MCLSEIAEIEEDAVAEQAKSKRIADLDAAWVVRWTGYPVPTSLPPGIVRRVDVLEMFDGPPSLSPDAAQSLVEAIGEAVDEILARKAIRWSPAPGYIDIHYGTLGQSAADLKHSVLVAAIERCIRLAIRGARETETEVGGEGSVPRRVDWEAFEKICAKAQARADQIQILDVSEALFGSPEPDTPLSQRLWNIVDQILDEALARTGYCTRYSRNRVLMFFPGYSKTMGELKRKSIATEIARAARDLVKRGPGGEETDLAVDAASEAKPAAKAPVGSRHAKAVRLQMDADEAERAHANQAFSALAAARADDLPDPAELELAPEFDIRAVPMWWAKKRTVGGYVLEPVQKNDEGWNRYFPGLSTQPDPLDLPFLARGILRIQEQVATGKSSLVVVPVHWPYLDRAKQRDRYIAYCSRLPEAARRLLVLELVGMPEDLMQARVEERINQLRSCCRAIICRVRLARRDFSQFKKLPVYAIGVDIGELPDYERGIIPGFDGFMNAVEPYGLQTYANGLTTKSLLVAVQAAGVDYVAGRVIPDSDQAPLGIREFEISDLYKVSASR